MAETKVEEEERKVVRETRLRGFGLFVRKDEAKAVRVVIMKNEEEKRKDRRQKRRSEDVLEKAIYMYERIAGMIEQDVGDGAKIKEEY